MMSNTLPHSVYLVKRRLFLKRHMQLQGMVAFLDFYGQIIRAIGAEGKTLQRG